MSSGCKQNWKLLVLIVLLKNRSCKRIRIEFGVSNYLARKAKKLVKQEIILTSADSKSDNTRRAEYHKSRSILLKNFTIDRNNGN
jgi:hypothetical protein